MVGTNGSLLTPDGFGRNYHSRGGAGFCGTEQCDFGKIEAGTNPIQGATVCPSFQSQQVQSPQFPRLKASPGEMVAIRYAENGHVTIREAGRPESGGLTWVYGTTQGTQNPKLTDVMGKWNADGTGGNKGGKLLTTQYFDDGRCYEMNPSAGSAVRQAAAPLNGTLPLPNYSGLHCQSNFRLPEDAPVGQPYTLYWVWNFSMVAQPQLYEYFTFCMDVDIVASEPATNKATDKYIPHQPVGQAAIPDYFSKMVANKAVGDKPTPATTYATSTPGTATTLPAAPPNPAAPINPAAPVNPAPGAPVNSAPAAGVPATSAAAAVTVPAPGASGLAGVGATSVPPTAAPAPGGQAPGLPSISVPSSLIPGHSAAPNQASQSSTAVQTGGAVVKTVTATQNVVKTVTPSMATVYRTVTVAPPVSSLSSVAPPSSSSSVSKAAAQARGTGNVAAASAAGSTPQAYDRRQFQPPSPTPSGLRRRGSAKFRLL